PWLSMTGRVPAIEVPERMARADVVVLPTLSDGFGRVLLEAQAVGVPIVATPHSAGPELISNGGGWIVQPGDVEGLARTLRDLARNRDEVTEAGERAFASAGTRTHEAFVENLLAEVHGLLECVSGSRSD